MEDEQKYIEALIKVHLGIERQGPGDTKFSNYILSLLKGLPENPRIADIGCGAGAGTLLLAETFKTKIRAVDFSREFLDELIIRAKQKGIEHLIEPIECDMGNLNWKEESIDLLWSEGSAYNLTFKGALETWKPLMAKNGIAVISEISYFSNEVPSPVRNYWQNTYPAIGTESTNSNHVTSSGFNLLGIHRLPSEAWWNNYYNPLKENMRTLSTPTDQVMQLVIEEMQKEMNLFKEYEKYYGYSFYIMKSE